MEALTALVILFLLLGAFAFWIWALIDAIRVPEDRAYREGTKLVWVLVIALTHFVGAVIYLLVGRPVRSTA
jgi:uncharacterized membrane protein